MTDNDIAYLLIWLLHHLHVKEKKCTLITSKMILDPSVLFIDHFVRPGGSVSSFHLYHPLSHQPPALPYCRSINLIFGLLLSFSLAALSSSFSFWYTHHLTSIHVRTISSNLSCAFNVTPCATLNSLTQVLKLINLCRCKVSSRSHCPHFYSCTRILFQSDFHSSPFQALLNCNNTIIF